ncbi:MAG: PspC domain-containing protein [Cytophagales bacterium]|nr:PspC domain-containing protein [Cytophagales bacterium]
MKKIQSFFEFQLFGVCTHLGEKLGIATSSTRMYFVYLSFFTFGSPIILYLVLAFAMDLRKHLRRNRSTIWDF